VRACGEMPRARSLERAADLLEGSENKPRFHPSERPIDRLRQLRLAAARGRRNKRHFSAELEGTLHDRDEGDLAAGDVLWMTAGRGIIHHESVEAEGHSRVLQLWIALSPADRGLAPRFEIVRKGAAPVLRAPGVEARLYSGTSGALRSPTRNRVPVTMLDLVLDPGATFGQDLPAAYNGFVYVLDGGLRIADTALAAGQVGWLAPSPSSKLEVRAGVRGARVVLYAGQPINAPIVQRGPFLAGSPAEIVDLNRRFYAGQFDPMSEVARHQPQPQQKGRQHP
jgi:redox-sensitive bicupin YhaK (pirin superfamily)